MKSNEVRIFEYCRGDDFKTKLIVLDNEIHCHMDEEYPTNCPTKVKLKFLEEAEVAVNKKLEDDVYGNRY